LPRANTKKRAPNAGARFFVDFYPEVKSLLNFAFDKLNMLTHDGVVLVHA
jgi:hypothetical protein